MVFSSIFLFWAAISCAQAQADVYRIIDQDQEALQIRVDLIQQATQELVLAYYTFDDDLTSLQLLSLLKDASDRGVKVYLLIDALHDQVSRSVRTLLERSGVQVAWFNAPDLDGVATVTRRMHDKYLISDYRRVLMGGRNIRESYFGLGQENFVDCDIYFEGPASFLARHFFISRWNSRKVSDAKIYSSKKDLSKADQILATAAKSLLDHPFVKMNRSYDWNDSKAIQTSSPVHFIYDSFNRHKDYLAEGDTADWVIGAINQAKNYVHLESPYVVPTRRLWKAIKDARQRGVRVRILTNSAISADTVLAQAAYQNSKKRLLKMGVDLYEFEVEGRTLHAKTLLVDGQIAMVGSYNLDPRSQNLNTETMSFVKDLGAASALEESMNSRLHFARKLEANGKPEGARNRFPGLSFAQKAQFRLWQYTLSILLRSQI